ncbi:MAG: hypothetical protein JKY45_06715 [Emcibacter sp.]|nr:hypothetical protein [Emcibacter sp.]
MSENIPVLFSAVFTIPTVWNGGEAYYTVNIGSASGQSPSTMGKGDPLHHVIIYNRKDPNAGPVFEANAPDNTTVPKGLEQYLTDEYIMFWVSAAFTAGMPQGALFKMLDENGGGRLLRRMEILSTAMACGVNANMVYMVASIPNVGLGGVEYLGQAEMSMSGGKDPTRVHKVAPYQMLLELIPAPNGDYTPLELS